MRRKRGRVRDPHPDPAVELELSRILDLRASISRRAGLIGDYRGEIRKLHSKARGAVYASDAWNYWTQASSLGEKIAAEEAAIAAVGEQISQLQAKLSPDDLAYL